MSDVNILSLVATSVLFCKELFAINDFELLTSCDLQTLGQGQSKSNNVVPGLCLLLLFNLRSTRLRIFGQLPNPRATTRFCRNGKIPGARF